MLVYDHGSPSYGVCGNPADATGLPFSMGDLLSAGRDNHFRSGSEWPARNSAVSRPLADWTTARKDQKASSLGGLRVRELDAVRGGRKTSGGFSAGQRPPCGRTVPLDSLDDHAGLVPIDELHLRVGICRLGDRTSARVLIHGHCPDRPERLDVNERALGPTTLSLSFSVEPVGLPLGVQPLSGRREVGLAHKLVPRFSE